MNFLKLKQFYKEKFIFIIFLLFNFSYSEEISALKKRSIISGVEVKVHTKERKHIETSALLCALAINGNSFEEIKINLYANFKKPISKSDQFLLVDVMNSMCPEIDKRKIFDNK